MGIQQLYVAAPRGFCAGVHRAVETLERAIALHGTPIYVRHEIIHNTTVVNDFKARGVVFVKDISEVPDGAVALFSAHGVAQQVVDDAAKKQLLAIDATCPLVTKVHTEAKHYAAQGTHMLLIGHRGHVEVQGTMGQAPVGSMTLVDGLAEAETVMPPQTAQLALITQTTLSVDETREMVAVLKARFPNLVTPKKEDICYATQNRQDAVKAIAPKVDVFFVVGSIASSNSNRLRETAERYGAKRAYLIDGPADITPMMLDNAQVVGLSSGASAPESVVQAVIAALAPTHMEEVVARQETMVFQLPKEVRPQEARVEITHG
ncbi:MAG: 4-hydroxy-3-methylbut-2-enyl diphosphate reductase [Alphaproteobacteria bacterium]